MTREHDAWEDLAEDWARSADPVPGNAQRLLVRRLRRATTRLWATVALEITIVAAVAGWTAYLWPDLTGIRGQVALAGAWVVVVVAVSFSFLNRRGIWWPAGNTTAAYLELCEERARRKLRTARFVATFVVVLLTLCMASLWLLEWRHGSLAAATRDLATLLVLAAVYLAWSWWFRGRARAELELVRGLRDDLRNEPEPDRRS